MDTTAESRLAPVTAVSPYLSRLFDARPELASAVEQALDQPLDAASLAAELGEDLDDAELKPLLRRLRERVHAHVAARDLLGLADLAEVTGVMSALAEAAIGTALRVLEASLVARHGRPLDSKGRPQQLIVIGMGKLGGRELNVSSDIDLIFVYPEEGETEGPQGLSNFEFFTRLGRRLIEALNEVTGDGQVFRVDMRLRPNGDSGPLVCPLEMLENYFITQGREWERYAWIKARPITGSHWEELAAVVRPFVFRKYLDYGAFDGMRDLHAQIRREVARRDMADNVKLGPGGIREVEFTAQLFQLIRGGRDVGLQIRPTLQVLEVLAARGILSDSALAELSSAYVFLRRLEHRLQYLEDAQTHRLPQRPEDQARIARSMGFAHYETLMAAFNGHRHAVSRHFESLLGASAQIGHGLEGLWQGAGNSDSCAAELARLGFQDAASAAQRLAAMHAGGRYRQMPEGVRGRFDALMPRVIETAARTRNPDQTLARSLALLDAISRREAYLALLQEYPQALQKVAQLVGASSWAAEYLTRHPMLLDELLDARLLDAKPDWPGFSTQLASQLAELEPDTERQMDVMREAHHSQVFRLLAQDLEGLHTVEKLADHLSELADRILELTLRHAWLKLRKRHREQPRFAIVSYGKLGGKELGYASDLDLIFLFDDDAPEAMDNYARLAQRVNTWLSSRTSAGILFETDLRLRPNGEAGLIVSSVDTFRRYQMESAWVWEHQALTRARFSAGDRSIGDAFEKIRIEILRKERDPETLKAEVLAMRARMRQARHNPSARFDLKHDRGGLIDVEFIVQFLVLGYSRQHPELTANLGNIALLRIAAQLGLIPAELAEAVRDAYREYRRLQHGLRLNGAQYARVDNASVALQVEAVLALWRTVFGG